jgi:oxygen-dependent protoporphyrinogen oxidase
VKIVILGGGISGLSAAWYVKKKYPQAKITLLEKSNRLGGCIETRKEGGFIFERGPRTFQWGKCPHLVQLIHEMGLQEQLIFSQKQATRRYLYQKGALHSMGSFLPSLFCSLLKEAFVAPSQIDDESIYDFAKRRFSPKIAETFFDPMTLGIYGGDIRQLSMKSCFPKIFAWEKEKGSCFRALFSTFLKPSVLRPPPLFSLKGGMESLISALAQKVEAEIILHSEVEALEAGSVFAGGKSFDADLIFSALPAPVIASLADLFFPLKQRSLWVAHVGYSEKVLKKQGFGYLVPSQEKEPLLGMIWDSSIFPQQYGAHETCLTAMMREENLPALKELLFRHLAISREPTLISSYRAENAIPQFEVGYSIQLEQFKKDLQRKFPNLHLLGNFLTSPSVEACIYRTTIAELSKIH